MNFNFYVMSLVSFFLLPSGHHMVVINNLDERLDLRTFGDLLLTHRLGNFKRWAFNASNDGITVRSVFSSFIVVYTYNIWVTFQPSFFVLNESYCEQRQPFYQHNGLAKRQQPIHGKNVLNVGLHIFSLKQ